MQAAWLPESVAGLQLPESVPVAWLQLPESVAWLQLPESVPVAWLPVLPLPVAWLPVLPLPVPWLPLPLPVAWLPVLPLPWLLALDVLLPRQPLHPKTPCFAPT